MRAAPDLSADRSRALKLTPVSRETAERLDRFAELFLRWQRAVQLVAPSTLPQLWTRHIADSLQLLDLVPEAKVWADLGSGGGFPGVVLATAMAAVLIRPATTFAAGREASGGKPAMYAP